MVTCAYCERPLICENCQALYTPGTPEEYEALSLPEATILCPTCEKTLVCHWCKTAYEAILEDEESTR